MDVADADTNGDGKIASSDHHALYVYRIGTAAPVKLIDTWWVSACSSSTASGLSSRITTAKPIVPR